MNSSSSEEEDILEGEFYPPPVIQKTQQYPPHHLQDSYLEKQDLSSSKLFYYTTQNPSKKLPYSQEAEKESNYSSYPPPYNAYPGIKYPSGGTSEAVEIGDEAGEDVDDFWNSFFWFFLIFF